MDNLGMEVVPVDLHDAYAFGGGLHCCTADVRREGGVRGLFREGVRGVVFSTNAFEFSDVTRSC
jgi:hypothetical protein